MVQCHLSLMTIPSSSDIAQYRVTFFFGPDTTDGRTDRLRCVFNVKKRSWKGGVQVAVDVAQEHLMRARDRMGYWAWLGQLLQRIEQTEHEAVTRRVRCPLDLQGSGANLSSDAGDGDGGARWSDHAGAVTTIAGSCRSIEGALPPALQTGDDFRGSTDGRLPFPCPGSECMAQRVWAHA